MRTKAATFTLLALIVASDAVPLSDRLSWSYVRNQVLHKRIDPVCSGARIYGLSSDKTEGDCANTPGVAGFRADNVNPSCKIPANGNVKKGMCYLGRSVYQRRSSPEDIDEPTIEAETLEQSSPSSAKKQIHLSELGEDVALEDNEESPTAATNGHGFPHGDQMLAQESSSSSPGSLPYSPDQVPKSPLSSVSDKPGAPNAAHKPQHPSLPVVNATEESKSFQWFGNSIFRILGSLF
ncbi:hypothetical protein J132_00075 [Termitomyces sp. J132]|nr:hypothetical protein H2248_000003 [Termitomyces sp. 'cryptogamus']KNZ71283.1 hypothetical protein J132_00075 [Termitomyces sp. J132]